MAKVTISTYELFQMFPDQEAARVYLEGRLWPMGPRWFDPILSAPVWRIAQVGTHGSDPCLQGSIPWSASIFGGWPRLVCWSLKPARSDRPRSPLPHGPFDHRLSRHPLKVENRDRYPDGPPMRA
jgi:hypothetical protein